MRDLRSWAVGTLRHGRMAVLVALVATTTLTACAGAVDDGGSAPEPTGLAQTYPAPERTHARPAPDREPARWWRPQPGTSWQWQLTGALDTSVDAAVFDVDGELTSAATVADLHRLGARAICYVDAGAWESYRPDADAFPPEVLGKPVEGWPEERWLDIRRTDVLLPIMEARIAACRDKGFDAVEPDLVEGYLADTGFPLTRADQLAYNRALAQIAHRHGLGIALKNTPELVAELEPSFDFAVVEECFAYRECDAYLPFIRAGKAVLHVEYEGALEDFCPTTTRLGFSSMKKRLSLDAWRQVCP